MRETFLRRAAAVAACLLAAALAASCCCLYETVPDETAPAEPARKVMAFDRALDSGSERDKALVAEKGLKASDENHETLFLDGAGKCVRTLSRCDGVRVVDTFTILEIETDPSGPRVRWRPWGSGAAWSAWRGYLLSADGGELAVYEWDEESATATDIRRFEKIVLGD